MNDLFELDLRGATLSDCGKYRYRLWRYWAPKEEGVVTFVLLNPSMADAERDDNTVRKCIGFARRWHYGGIEIVNAYARRASDPHELVKLEEQDRGGAAWAKGGANYQALHGACNLAQIIVAGWGGWGERLHFNDQLLAVLRTYWGDKLRTLRMNRDGTPEHPLYVPYGTEPILIPYRHRQL